MNRRALLKLLGVAPAAITVAKEPEKETEPADYAKNHRIPDPFPEPVGYGTCYVNGIPYSYPTYE